MFEGPDEQKHDTDTEYNHGENVEDPEQFNARILAAENHHVHHRKWGKEEELSARKADSANEF